MTATQQPSTDEIREQQHREERERRRAIDARRNNEARLKAAGADSLLGYGRRLLRVTGDGVVKGLVQFAGEQLANPTAGPHHGALLQLVEFGSIAEVVMIATAIVVDGIGRPRAFASLAAEIGRELDMERMARRLEERDPLLFRELRRRHSRHWLIGKRGQRAMRCTVERWETERRHEIGALVLAKIAEHSGLVRLELKGKGRTVLPTAEAMRAIKQAGPPPVGPQRSLMVVPPKPWPGLVGGGHLDAEAPLILVPPEVATDQTLLDQELGWIGAHDLTAPLQAVNHLQAQRLEVDADMLQVQVQAWEGNMPGLFPCLREPPPLPPRMPYSDASEEEFKRYRREVAQHHGDLERNGAKRLSIEQSLRASQELAGRTVWQAHVMDFRGRVYTANRRSTHQGPDHEKAALRFGQGAVADVDGFEWMLRAAAGHWGEATDWGERLRWGKDRIDMFAAISERPLELANEWREAKQPWQFLQMAQAITGWLRDPSAPVTVPIRFDQTTSGSGIIAALLRDLELAELCNLVGGSRSDLYGFIAQHAIAACERDLHTGDEHKRKMAAFWLGQGIDRSLVKGAVLAVPYGGKHMGAVSGLCSQLEKRLGWVPGEQWNWRVMLPCAYLARILRALVAEKLPSLGVFTDWSRKLCAAVIAQQRPLRWIGPSGFPVELAELTPVTIRVRTVLHGKPCYVNFEKRPPDGELSARQTNTAAAANIVHSFDAAFCHVIACRAAEHGVPLLTVHDCFATLPSHATWLHRELCQSFGRTYEKDWLAELHSAAKASGGKKLPRLPQPGGLWEGRIGENTYLFS
jgi:DNA-directed RNA polymerase